MSIPPRTKLCGSTSQFRSPLYTHDSSVAQIHGHIRSVNAFGVVLIWDNAIRFPWMPEGSERKTWDRAGTPGAIQPESREPTERMTAGLPRVAGLTSPTAYYLCF